MCGILGTTLKIEKEVFQQALQTINHRGPDCKGVWRDDSVTFGHQRLSILDLSENGKQPMEFMDRYVITFNGEIYNYVELKKELEKKNIRFRTQTDTEVLLALYAEEGPACLNKLNGMWAFAIFDKQEKTLFFSRDRMGKKPLFYTQKGNDITFGSEMKALYPFLGSVEPNRELVQRASQNVFCYESTEHCLINGIKRFPAASSGIFKDGKLTIESFWKPLETLIKVPKSYDQQVEMFRELFIDSCKIRMRSDVPIGTALSGGIDSSATISTMAYVAKNLPGEFSRDWQHAFVASFPDSSIDETGDAKKVVDHLGIPATFLNIDPLKDIDKLYYDTYLFEELYLTPSIPFIQLYNRIKQSGTTVTLDGHGSDELFGGYRFDMPSKLWDDYPNFFKMRRTLQTSHDMALESSQYSHQELVRYYKNYTKQFVASKGKKSPFEEKHEMLDYMNNRLYNSTFNTILPTLLRNYDRYSMINGVEVLMPFLDHRIVLFAFSIPGSSKVRNGYGKAIVRDAMKGFFPESIRLLKRKVGFTSPFTEWIKGDLKEWFLDEMNSNDFKQATLIDPVAVKQKIKEVIDDENANYLDGEEAWKLLMPYVWERSLEYATCKQHT